MHRRLAGLAVAASVILAACGGESAAPLTVEGLADRLCAELKTIATKPEGEQVKLYTDALNKAGKDGEAMKLIPEAFGAAMVSRCPTEFLAAAAKAGGGGETLTADGLADRICNELKGIVAKPAGEQKAAFGSLGAKIDADADANKLSPEAVGTAIMAKCLADFGKAASAE
ncbi:MAG: hypothetical protein FJ029_03440 [Actinobacteria bacterium]|nr:hypothetical protein [Actinomycetota bacterium]